MKDIRLDSSSLSQQHCHSFLAAELHSENVAATQSNDFLFIVLARQLRHAASVFAMCPVTSVRRNTLLNSVTEVSRSLVTIASEAARSPNNHMSGGDQIHNHAGSF